MNGHIKLERFVPHKPFQLSIMFVGKAKEPTLEWGT
jgi:hypothetical protein